MTNTNYRKLKTMTLLCPPWHNVHTSSVSWFKTRQGAGQGDTDTDTHTHKVMTKKDLFCKLRLSQQLHEKNIKYAGSNMHSRWHRPIPTETEGTCGKDGRRSSPTTDFSEADAVIWGNQCENRKVRSISKLTLIDLNLSGSSWWMIKLGTTYTEYNIRCYEN